MHAGPEDDSSYLEIFMIACKYAILILKLLEYVKSEVFLITAHLFSARRAFFHCMAKIRKKQTDFNLRYDLLMVFFAAHTHVCVVCARINYMYDEQ